MYEVFGDLHLWGFSTNQNWSSQPDICSSTLKKKETEVTAYMTVKEKWRKNWLMPRLDLWPFTSGTNAGDVNYRAEMKHKKMRIRSVPVGLLKTISNEPWRPKMYNTNHSWHLLTAQVMAANNLHREHCHHKQPVKASSLSQFGPLQHAATEAPTELSQLFLLLVVLRLRAAREGIWGHRKGFWVKGQSREAFKNHFGNDAEWRR